jgi:hypothetical protein
MKIEKVSMQKQHAKNLWREYNQVLKTKAKDYRAEVDVLKKCYYQLSKGRPIVNIQDVFRKTGWNEKFYPKFAFSPAKLKKIYFVQTTNEAERGEGRFQDTDSFWSYKTKLWFKNNTFPIVKRQRDLMLKAPVPIIPPKFLPKKVEGHYLLWEVEDWEELRPKRDPILLKHIDHDLYCVIASWSLTKLEAMIIRGRI